jgi:fimbrial isopeptide formation D2 family protein/LPXTG-motif cell wall-anchored protein
VAANLSATHTDSTAVSSPYTVAGLADGYYFINEKSFSGTVDNAYTKYILQVVDDVVVSAKTDKPAITLKVRENNDVTYKNTWNDAADYNVTDNVPYRIVSLVPDMSSFETYYYKITDTLSDGSTFNADSVKVYYVSGGDMYAVETNTTTGAGGTLLDSGKYALANTGSGFTVTFADLKNTSGVAGNGYIVVEYTATLDKDAVIGNPGNPTEVYLTYSNNPNNSGADSTEHGQTPKDEVVVYTFTLPVNKVDGEDKALSGATFALFTTKEAADAAVINPVALTDALKFDGSAGVYLLNSTSGTVSVIESAAEGTYAIKGLDQGTYYLVEITEPIGYNRLTAPVTVVVDSAYNDGSKSSAYVDGHTPDATADQLTGVTVNAGSSVKVINQAGSTLPETGSIGTTIFTIVGLMLMLVAAVLFVAKRRMSVQKE